MNRHRGIIYGKGTDGGPLDEQTKARYARYNAKPTKGLSPARKLTKEDVFGDVSSSSAVSDVFVEEEAVGDTPQEPSPLPFLFFSALPNVVQCIRRRPEHILV